MSPQKSIVEQSKNIIKNLVRKVGYDLLRVEYSESLRNEEKRLNDVLNRLIFLQKNSSFNRDITLGNFFTLAPEVLKKSTAQLFQDVFVLHALKQKRGGYFVEFGATNGKSLSNTWMLEKYYGWSGILAEPAKIWHPEIIKNRNCEIDKRCVWSESGKTLEFEETDYPELSTIEQFSGSDYHASRREKYKMYSVETVSLEHLLSFYHAPSYIDYLSIDTEGSEYQILKNFDFSKYTFRVITVEHNYSPQRKQIYDLLIRNGYKRVFEQISFFDDWYIGV